MPDKLVQQITVKMAAAAILLASGFFVTAGTIFYWYGWSYLGLLFGSITFIAIHLLRHDRQLLERRLRTRKTEETQKVVTGIGLLPFLLLLLIPGVDYRFGWSSVPVPIIVLADVAFIFGYCIFYLTLRENSYASRVIEVENGQKVVSTGPYSVVRHPMYLAILIIMGFTPLCLGSYFGTIMIVPLLLLLVFRILNEEKMLLENLPGYREYFEKTKYRLIPKVW